jgi:diacylglycerol kinase (ATP)
MKRILQIENPRSGQSDTDTNALRRTCLDQGWELVMRPVTPNCKFADLLADAAQFDAVVGVGGDGTISGLAAHLSGSDVPLLAWPGGTANLVAQNLFPALTPEALCQALVDGQVLSLDMGELQAGDVTQRFVMLAGAGTDARMIRDSEELKSDWGVAAYVKALLGQLDREPEAIELTIDGEHINEDKAVGVLVANLSKLNFGFPMGDDIDGQDGLLDVIVIRHFNSGLLLQEIWNATKRRFGGATEAHPDLGLYQGRDIQLKSATALPLQYDGEPMDVTTPVAFRVLPKVLRVFGYPEAGVG